MSMLDPYLRPRTGRHHVRPELLTNPADDGEFRAFAEALLEHHRELPAFERALRERYPHANVHERALAGEQFVLWYVYREGRWIARAPESAR